MNENSSDKNENAMSIELARQQALQDAAERAERDGLPAGDPQIDAYRLIMRSVQHAPMAEIPADFAQSTLVRLQTRQRSDALERIMTQILGGVLVIAGAVLALPPALAAIIGAVRQQANPTWQWPLIVSAGLALAVVWVADRAWTQRTPQH